MNVSREKGGTSEAAISSIAGQSYTLDNVRVVLVPEREEQAEPPQNTPPPSGEERASG